MTGVVAFARSGFALFGGLVAVGLVAIVGSVPLVERTDVVAYQLPAVVSGGLGGLALVLFGLILLHTQVSRRIAAAERAQVEVLLDDLAAAVRTARGEP